MPDPKIILPEIVSRDAWLKERKELLREEKEFTRKRDELNARRRRLPMVEIEEDYVFEGPEGEVSLLHLFEGRRQLIIYHFMFHPEWDKGCRSCSAWADHIARGHLNHLRTRGTTLAVVSRAPLMKIKPFKEKMGWTFPWYSSYDSDFNYDYHVTLDESVTPIEYNYRNKAELKQAGMPTNIEGAAELPGLSCFLRDGERIFHTYSTYARGTETVGGANYFLDLTSLGRQEEWEEPIGRVTGLGAKAGSTKILYPDEYEE